MRLFCPPVGNIYDFLIMCYDIAVFIICTVKSFTNKNIFVESLLDLRTVRVLRFRICQGVP